MIDGCLDLEDAVTCMVQMLYGSLYDDACTTARIPPGRGPSVLHWTCTYCIYFSPTSQEQQRRSTFYYSTTVPHSLIGWPA